MRILVAHNVSRRYPGGMTRIMELLHRPLSFRGHQIDYLHSDDVPHAVRGRLARFAFPWLVRRQAVNAAAAGRPYDIVNVHEPMSAVAAMLRHGMGNAAVVAMSHGLEQRAWELALEERALGRDGPGLLRRAWYPVSSLWQSRLGLTHADGVVCLSFQDRDYLQERMGVQAERITRLFPGADPQFAHASAGRDYHRASRLVFAGTWRNNKGVRDLVPAFTSLAQRDGDLALTVLGGGVPEQLVRAAFPDAVRSRVRLISTHTDAETARVLAESDIFVLPSLFEGTPLTLIEAMMSGLPIVTTSTCGMRDVIRDGENGLLVPIRSPVRLVEALERLMVDEALRARLGCRARGDARDRYTWDRNAGDLLAWYEGLRSMRLAGRLD